MNQVEHDLLTRIDERVGKLIELHADQEIRIRQLEKWRNILAGGLAAVASSLSAIGYKFTH